MDKEAIIEFYKEAKQFCIEQGYQWEIELVYNRTWEQAQPDHFFAEYCFVVFNAGMKNQVAQKIYEKFMATMNMELHGSTMQDTADLRIKSLDVSVIGHKGKREAIRTAMSEYQRWFKELQDITPKKQRFYEVLLLKTAHKRTINEVRVAYLETLPWIGKITKYHLARNLGIDVAKPDRHLVRLSEKFGFRDVHEMCEYISKNSDERVGVVDLVLWRSLNLGFGASWQRTPQDVQRTISEV